ncbi:heavy metal translocating P-type ATPase [Amycolatopsis sp. NPDC050768]|uniref:heavy metal translocating P-type ATPase n=1 Tax=Amycolatopsis sp. NPDC050768 TaxID=3154839 RepID=UPI0033FA8849
MTSVAPVRSVELAIGGMTCAACAARVERKLNKLDGVRASVNFATERAIVESDAPPDEDVLLRQVSQAGYTAEVLRPERMSAARGDEARRVWRRLVVALLLGIPAADLSFTLALVPSLRFTGWQAVVLALAAPVLTWSAWPFHRKAAVALRHGSTSMDTLVSAGILAATAWSLYSMFGADTASGADGVWGLLLRPAGSIYLDVAIGVTVFVLAGRLYEARAKRTAGAALRALSELGAKAVSLLDEHGGERRVRAAELRAGDRFVVRPGETIAADGVVLDGACTVDGATMTGESVPRDVTVGDTVLGATVALGGRLVVRATHIGADSRIGLLTRLVERAQHDKASAQRLADRISAVFVPTVVALAVLTAVGWALAGSGAPHAFSAGLAVLIIACPCALGLATPTALLVASGRGAQLGIFLKGTAPLDSAREVDTVVFDKTGTVTTGQLVVTGVRSEQYGREEFLRLVGAVETASEHPIAAAITAEARAEAGEVPMVEEFKSLSGLGARGSVEGHDVLVGSTRLLRDHGIALSPSFHDDVKTWEHAGLGVVAAAVDGTAAGLIAVADTLRPTAPAAISALHGLRLRTILLTGDREATARTIAARAGIDEVIADVLPDGKAAVIDRLKREGRTVAMVGDGVNDAPALARADLGLAMVTGTDVAAGAADMILVSTDLSVVPRSLRLARATTRTIRGNLWWAFGYNIAALPLAAAGLLNPLVSAAAMALSSLFVVSNSLRLRTFDADRQTTVDQ